MANSLNLLGDCIHGPLVECSYDYSTSPPRYKYVIRRATSASYKVGTGSTVGITITDNGATGYITWNATQTVTITAKGCGCDAVCVIPPCCTGKDYLRLTLSGFRDLNLHYERTLPPPDFGTRNIFGSWDTTITGLAALNGTWLIPVESGTGQPYQCNVAPLDTGIDVAIALRWFSWGARYTSTQVLTSETWDQELNGNVSGRLWLHYDNIWISGNPGTMFGKANKTVGLSGGYNTTFDSAWSVKTAKGPFQNAEPIISPGNGIVTYYSGSTTNGFGGVGNTSLFNFLPALCGQRKASPVFLTQYGSSHWVAGERPNPATNVDAGTFVAGKIEAQYIVIP